MASAPFSSVSVECVNICKYSKGDGSGRYDCSPISCAWKAPRALTGLLASTAHSSSSAFHHGQSERRSRHIHRCEAAGMGAWLSFEALDQVQQRRLARSSLLHRACRKWVVGCSSSSSSGYDDVSPERLWEDLKPAIAYLTSDELKLVQDALNLAFEAHDGQKRRSGEPFIIHPVEVARILGELELDWESIAAGLLHDTVEDTNLVTFEKIEEQFGSTVRHIVEGETKVSKLGKLKYKNENHSVQDVKAHDLRQMFLAMTEEVRVIIVKLADKLHKVRTLLHMSSHKQASIAIETLKVFAPLAKLLGMYQIKVICSVRDSEQPVVRQCTNYGVYMGEYHSEIFKFFDDDVCNNSIQTTLNFMSSFCFTDASFYIADLHGAVSLSIVVFAGWSLECGCLREAILEKKLHLHATEKEDSIDTSVIKPVHWGSVIP